MKSFCLLLLHATFLGKVEHGNDKIAVPERVTYTILKVNEIVFVNPHQVSAVEVQISLSENVTESLALRLVFVLGIAHEGSYVGNLGYQQSSLALNKNIMTNSTVKY